MFGNGELSFAGYPRQDRLKVTIFVGHFDGNSRLALVLENTCQMSGFFGCKSILCSEDFHTKWRPLQGVRSQNDWTLEFGVAIGWTPSPNFCKDVTYSVWIVLRCSFGFVFST